MNCRAALLLLYSFITFSALSQDREATFKRISASEGLCQNDINSIFEDSRGLIWVGTNGGLTKFDGYSFTCFKNADSDPNSLGGNIVHSIAEDRNHNLWLGTLDGGINMFDRKTEKFTRYKFRKNDDKSLLDNRIEQLIISSEHILWVATSKGINRANLNTDDLANLDFERFRMFDRHCTGLKENYIKSVAEDKKGTIWLGYAYNGVAKVISSQTDGKLIVKNSIIPKKQHGKQGITLNKIRLMKDGRLFFTSNEGLFYIDDSQEIPAIGVLNRTSKACRSVAIDRKGIVWVTSLEGLFTFKQDENNQLTLLQKHTHNYLNIQSLSSSFVNSLLLDQAGNLWIGTKGSGLNLHSADRLKFDFFKKNYRQNSLSDNNIRSILEDSNGDLWIGTRGRGLNKAVKDANGNFKYNDFLHIENTDRPSIRNRSIVALEEVEADGKKMLYMGLEGTGVFRMELKENDYTTSEFLIEELSHIRVNGRPPSVMDLMKDREGYIWVCSYQAGLFRLEKDSENFKHFNHEQDNTASICSAIVRSILQDRNGNFWVGTGDGLNMLPKEEVVNGTFRFKQFKHDSKDKYSISNNYILPIAEDQKGNIWFGTFGGGLNKVVIDPDTKEISFRSFKEKNGLAHDIVKSIVVDKDGYLWIGTNGGLSKLDPETEEFNNYGVDDGLVGQELGELASFMRPNGQILLGNVKGVNILNPAEIKDNLVTPKVILSNLRLQYEKVEIGKKYNDQVILEKSIGETKKLDLSFNTNSFELEFAALDFAAPEQVKYAYMLAGFDQGWIYTDSKKRYAKYTNLPSGDYEFLVKASNNDGIWNENPTTLKITIATPYWQQWWFWLGAITVFLFMVSAIVFNQYRVIHNRRKKLELLVKSRTAELELSRDKAQDAAKAKADFLSVMSHEIRTPMNAVIALIHLLMEENKDKCLNENIKTLNYSAQNLMTLINDILDFSKLESGKTILVNQPFDLNNFFNSTRDLFKIPASRKQLKFVTKFDPEVPDSVIGDAGALNQVLSNLLSNAIKFTNKGIITLSSEVIEKNKNNVAIKFAISDTGIGVPEEKQQHIFDMFTQAEGDHKRRFGGTGLGLAICTGLVKIMGGQLKIDSKVGKGTTFYFTLKFDIPLQDVSAPAEVKKETFSNTLFNIRALIVDDNEINRMVLRKFLVKWKVFSDEATGGLEALEKIKNNHYDLILMDIHMPDMDGYTTAENIRKNPDPIIGDVPIMAISADVNGRLRKKIRSVGINESISKPFNPTDLFNKMVSLVQQKQALSSE